QQSAPQHAAPAQYGPDRPPHPTPAGNASPLAAQGITGPCTDIENQSKMTVPAFANLRTVRCSIFSCGACDGRFERVGLTRWECKSVRLEKGPRRRSSGGRDVGLPPVG